MRAVPSCKKWGWLVEHPGIEDMSSEPLFVVWAFLVGHITGIPIYRDVGHWLCQLLEEEGHEVPFKVMIGLESERENISIGEEVGWVLAQASITRSVRSGVTMQDVRDDMTNILQAIKSGRYRQHSRVAIVRMAEAATVHLRTMPMAGWKASKRLVLGDERLPPKERWIHEDAKRLLSEPIFWSDVAEWAPHGSDLGWDVMKSIKLWKRRGMPGGVPGLVADCHQRYVGDGSEEEMDKITVAIAIGVVNVTGACPSGLAKGAVVALGRIMRRFGPAARPDILAMRRVVRTFARG